MRLAAPSPATALGPRASGVLDLAPAGAAVAAAAAFALSLQVQATLGTGGSALRLSLADLLAAALAPLLLLLLLRRGEGPLSGQRPLWAALIVPASAAMASGFLVGAAHGGVDGWMLGKFAGWFALLAFALCGCLLARRDVRGAPLGFARFYVAGVGLATAAYIGLACLGMRWPLTGDSRLSGLIDNPNAFALIAVCAAALALALGPEPFGRRSRAGWEGLVALLTAGALFTRSLAAVAALMAVGAVYLLAERRPGVVLRVAVLAGLIFAAPAVANRVLTQALPEIANGKHRVDILTKAAGVLEFGAGPRTHFYDNSLRARLDANAAALRAWRARPLLGVGLGGFLKQQRAREHAGRPAMVIHNTPLWLLTEFGLVGFALFLSLFAAFALHLAKAMRRCAGTDRARARTLLAGLLVMSGWAVMSLAHELMYQRVPWFILGMCAGVALAGAAKERTASER